MGLVKATLFPGFLVWVIPFMAGFLAFPLRTSDRPLFESIMAVVLVLTTVLFGLRYLKKASVTSGLITGLWWLAICVALDLVVLVMMFKTPFVDYLKDIALTYLIIPTITFGLTQTSSEK